MKKILSLAIAAALVVPAAAMAEATVYGKAHMLIQNTDDGSEDVWSVDSVASSVGVKGSEDLGDGLKAIYQFEFEIDDEGDGLKDKNQYLGLAGGFGTVLLGRHDTPLKMAQGSFDQFGDVAGDIKKVMPGEDRLGNVIAYVSPDMGGFSLVGATVAGEDSDSELTGLADHFSVAGLYSNGPIFASLAYNSYDLGSINTADPFLMRGTFMWKGDMWQAGVMYASVDADGLIDDADAVGVSGHVRVGSSGKIKAQYLVGDTPIDTTYGVSLIGGAENEVSQMSLGYEHALSKSTTLHGGYTVYEEDDGDEEDTLFVGMIHKF